MGTQTTPSEHTQESPRELALKLRRLRALHGYSQVELARRAGISPASLARLERGAGAADRKALESLASAFGISPGALGGTKAKEP